MFRSQSKKQFVYIFNFPVWPKKRHIFSIKFYIIILGLVLFMSVISPLWCLPLDIMNRYISLKCICFYIPQPFPKVWQLISYYMYNIQFRVNRGQSRDVLYDVSFPHRWDMPIFLTDVVFNLDGVKFRGGLVVISKNNMVIIFAYLYTLIFSSAKCTRTHIWAYM